MDEITHTIMPSGGQWGGAALGAGVGGLIGSWLGNGGFGGFGAGGVPGQRRNDMDAGQIRQLRHGGNPGSGGNQYHGLLESRIPGE